MYTSIFNGVDIFFVLSGFLITRILLENRTQAEEKQATKINLVKSFFARRFLRIFPIYYLVLVGLFILGDKTGTAIRQNYFYFFTYTANIYFFKIQTWEGMLSHLWSLSVALNFYQATGGEAEKSSHFYVSDERSILIREVCCQKAVFKYCSN